MSSYANVKYLPSFGYETLFLCVIITYNIMFSESSFDNIEESKVIGTIPQKTDLIKVVLIVLCHWFGISPTTK